MKRGLAVSILVGVIALSGSLVASAQTWVNKKVDLNIVAHQDDDILFMNPDILNAVKNGQRQVTVYITGGNLRPDDLNYAQDREQGAMDGYSQLLQIADTLKVGGFSNSFTDTFSGNSRSPLTGGDSTFQCQPYKSDLTKVAGGFKWQRTQIPIGSRLVEIATTGDLVQGWPRVMLIFLRTNASRDVPGIPVEYNLQGEDFGPLAFANLDELFCDPNRLCKAEWPTVIKTPDGRNTYTKQQLLSTLVEIFKWVRPGVVRTQDSENPFSVDGYFPGDPNQQPAPYAYVIPDVGDPGNGEYYDHSDHYWGSRFAKEALRQYRLLHPDYTPTYNIYSGYNLEWTEDQNSRLMTKEYCFKKSIMYFYALNDQSANHNEDFGTYWYWFVGYQKRVTGTLP